MADPIDLSIGLEGTHVLITGAGGYIGTVTVSALLSAGASVSAVDVVSAKLEALPTVDNLLKLTADISSESQLITAFNDAHARFGPVLCVIALASLDLSVLPHHSSVADMPLDQWQRTFKVNVEGTFLTARTWLREVRDYAKPGDRNVGLVIVGSESGSFGERGNPDYASGKSAVQFGLVQSMKSDVVRIFEGARVNAIAPGPVDTVQFRRECKENPEQLWLDSQATTAMRKPVPVSAVAKNIIYLASQSWSGHVHGQVLNVDSGKFGKLLWSKDEIP